REAAERAGLMADLFLNGDDVEWCCRIRRRTGQRIGIATASRARHPRPDRMRTGARYYAARNAFPAIAAAEGGRPPRRLLFRRALRETGRALAMTMLGRDDLAALHLRGLRDATAGVRGPAPGGLAFEPFAPPEGLPRAVRDLLFEGVARRGRIAIRAGTLPDEAPLRKALHDACVDPVSAPSERQAYRRPGPAACARRILARLARGPGYGLAIVPARGYPEDWLFARVIVSVAPEGFAIRRLNRAERAGRLIRVMAAGLFAAARLAIRGVPAPEEDQPAPGPEPNSRSSSGATAPALPRPTVSAVILSYNRFPALEKTVERLLANPDLAGAEIIVADNASTDGTPEKFHRRFRDLRLIDMGENIGVAAFNHAVARTTGETILILDDDAWPDDGALGHALDLLAARPPIAAVALHPRHPQTRASEWAFIDPRAAQPDDRFPFMGCGNLIRRDAWDRAGGYEEAFFLYRNDVDLALTLLRAGHGVHFNPAWTVWHDSPAARRKSPRWFELATRNWVWVCRRHGAGGRRRWLILGILGGWAWAHRLAGLSPRAHWRTLWGAIDGLWNDPPPPPQVPGTRSRGGGPLERLMRYRLRRLGKPHVREPRPD
ncbi:MAG: glycosyltransferase family 2 protein, partial [Phycisphaerales bacterium]